MNLPVSNFPINWIGTPGAHQVFGVERALEKNEFAFLWEPGAGKTYGVVHVAKTRFRMGQLDLVIVICPNSIKQVWPAEFAKWAPDTQVEVKLPKTKDALKRPNQDTLEVVVIAIESLSQGGTYNKIMAYLKGRRAMVVCDESSRIKNPASIRTKNATNIAWSAWYRLILTGTPVLQGPHDLFAQFRFLNPEIIGITKWAAFKARYCIIGGFENRQIIGHHNIDDLINRIKPYAQMVRLQDCVDIPHKIYQKIPVQLSDEQRGYIRQLKDEGTLVLENLGTELYVEMALERMTRIQQIVGGSIPMWDEESGKYKTIPLQGKIPKLEAMLDYIENGAEGHKYLVWARFTPERDRICAALSEKYGPESVVRFDGEVKDEELRKQAVWRLQNDPKCLFFVGNQAVAGIGLTLTAATTALNYSNTFSAEDRIQMENRNHRTGQTNHCVYVDFEAMVKEDRMITRALALKQDLSEYVKASMQRGQDRDADMEGYE